MCLLLIAIPLAAILPPLTALAGVALVLAAVAAVETRYYTDLRHAVRD